MNQNRIIGILFILMPAFLYSQKCQDPAFEYYNKLKQKIESFENMQFDVFMYARMKDGDYHQKARIKFVRNPKKVYYKQHIGRNIEFLYNETKDRNNAIINPDGFPYVNVNISPYSSKLLIRQHHSIFEADPLFSINQMDEMLKKLNCKDIRFSIQDTILGEIAYKSVVFINDKYSIVKQRIRSSICLVDLAKQMNVNYYSICIENNVSIGHVFKRGDIVRIPSTYARKLVFLTDSDFIIKEIEVYDQYGLFEKFNYESFDYNVMFHANEFESDYQEYNF